MTELKDQLTLLGRKTEYKQDYAPEVLEAFDNKHPEMIIGYALIVRNSPVCVPSQGSPILRRYGFHTSPT